MKKLLFAMQGHLRWSIPFLLFLGLLIGLYPLVSALAATGGPDGGGYFYSDTPGATFEDMTGASSVILGDGGLSPAIPLGFNFTFYETTYSSIYLCANGVLQFQNLNTCAFQASPIPSVGNAFPMVAAWWGDLDPSLAGGTILVKSLGSAPNRIFVVEFNTVLHYGGLNPVTFQIKLFETTNMIEVHYQAAPASFAGTGAFVNHGAGIQKDTLVGLQYYYGLAALPGVPVTVRYQKDNVAPETSLITDNLAYPPPANPTSETSASFVFTGNDPLGTGIAYFECLLIGEPFNTCSSPITYSGLSDGSQTFQVRAVDTAGNADPSPVSYTWLIDTIPPDTTITANPANLTNQTSASFSFTGSDPGGSGVASFQCCLDGGEFSACTSPAGYTGLADGSYTFQVRAVDAVGFVDANPASFTWVIETIPPDTTITANPANPTNQTSASFSFTGSDLGVAGVSFFQCSLDGSVFSMCTSPAGYTGLADGPHTFQVRAVDTAGNVDATPASFTWVIDATTPETTITATPANPTNQTSASFSFTGSDPGGLGVASYQCRLDGAVFSACTSPAGYTGLADGPHIFQVRAVDLTGNVDATPASFTWIIDTTGPETSITSKPADPTALANASFEFSGTDVGGTGVVAFECKLDSESFSLCTSPKEYTGLANGTHTFEVSAVDAVGNRDNSPASYTWRVDTSLAPRVPVLISPANNSIVFGPKVLLRWQANENVAGYLVKIDGGPAQDVGKVLQLDLDITGLALGDHTWTVAAYNAEGLTSDYAAEWVFTIRIPVFLPIIFR